MKDRPRDIARLRDYLDRHPDKRNLVASLARDPDGRMSFFKVIEESFGLTRSRTKHELTAFVRQSQ